jgi:hypothetical protein
MGVPSQPATTDFSTGKTSFVLLAFGFLAILSIGMYFLLLGVALILLSPFRSRPSIFRPGLARVTGFIVGKT